MKRNPRIVVVGSSNTDMVIKADRIPKPGETVLGGEFVSAAGGKGANQAVAAARLGAEVSLVARVGGDVFGDLSIGNFRDEGIRTEFVVRDLDRASGVALIVVGESGENIITVAPGANGALSGEDVLAAKDQIRAADVLLLQLEVPLDTVRRAARLAAEAGVTVILNPAPACPLDDDLLRDVTVLTPNESEAELLTGLAVHDPDTARRAAEVLKRRGASSVIITMGAAGAYLSGAEVERLIPAPQVTAVDTTAAGDAFSGALACALAVGRPLEEAVRFSNFNGALAATRLGAQPSLPSDEELSAFIGAAGFEASLGGPAYA